MEAHSTIKFDENHELLEVSGTLINIDERKQEETAKKESENKLSRITENISDIITEFDEQVNVLYISKSIQQLTGVEPKDVVGINVLKDVHPDDFDLVQEKVLKPLLAGAKMVVEQFRIHKKDGGYVWIESIMQPLISSSGGRTFIATIRDISARHDAEQEMQRALQTERDLNVLKSRFITMTSHEFRTPLSSIQSSIELLEMYAEDLGERFMRPFEKHFQKVTSQVSRINSLLNNIDTLGKIEGMEMPFNPINQNLVEFVKNLISEKVSEDFPNRTVNLKILGEPTIVNVDPLLIDNMLCNILKNAFLYCEKETPDCTIQFNKNDFVISVEDKGLGIPEDEMSHLFQSFFRARNIVNLNIPGNGLGVVIAKRIADIHNGTIIVESDVNVGTKGTMTLPIQQ
jgi:PAS domain S-box-containing protein